MSAPPQTPARPLPAQVEVLIVGAGFSGLGMAIALRRAHRPDFIIVEQAEAVGGTWQANTYPGCACDVPSHLYSFSFAPNPHWSRAFSPQEEIRHYLEGCVQRFDLGPQLHLNTRVRAARFDEPSALWHVEIEGGPTIKARDLVLGLGALSRPALPQLEGIEAFRGEHFHSARWRHDLDLRGRRVAVIGTGASAIQIVPELAPLVEELTVYQRTAPWVLPKPDHGYPGWLRAAFAHVPGLRKGQRALQYWQHELRGVSFTLAPPLMAIARRQGLAHLRRQVPDAKLRAVLEPKITPGCKRILLSNDYYRALAQPHVRVVPAGAARAYAEGLEASDGQRRPHDVLIFATGFRVTDLLSPLEIFGVGGADLNARWAQGIEAYLGAQIAGFPNLFMLMGPNSGLGHNSMIFMIEAQIAYAMRCMAQRRRRRAGWVDLAPSTQARFNAELHARHRRTVWASGCSSWYLDERSENPTLWPGLTLEFWLRSRHSPLRGLSFGGQA